MKLSSSLYALPLGLLALTTVVALAQEEETVAAAYVEDFEKVEDVPADLFIIDGEWALGEEAENHYLEMNPLPLVEGAVLFGKSTRGATYAEVRILAVKQRRSFPRFGVGVHGLSGFRFRVVPARNEVELLKGDEVITTAPYEWKADEWCVVRLEVSEQEGEEWKIQGWAWAEGTERPEEPLILHEDSENPGQGKASAWGTPYNGKAIKFDDLKSSQ